jgi:hypothetical protein
MVATRPQLLHSLVLNPDQISIGETGCGKSRCFEGARLQPRCKYSVRSAALAAEGIFPFSVTFSAAWKPADHNASNKGQQSQFHKNLDSFTAQESTGLCLFSKFLAKKFLPLQSKKSTDVFVIYELNL